MKTQLSLSRNVICCLSIGVFNLNCLAQTTGGTTQPDKSKFTLQLSAGYTFGLGNAYLGENYTTTTAQSGASTTRSVTEEGVYGSWGQGMNYSALLTWIDKCGHFGGGLNINYLDGKKFTWSDISTSTFTGGSFVDNEEYSGSMNSFRVTPFFIYQGCPCHDNFVPYAKVGPQLNISNIIKQTETTTSTTTTGSNVVVNEYYQAATWTGNFNVGLSAAAGVKYDFKNSLGLYGEVFFNNSNIMPKSWKITDYTHNGEDILGNLTTAQKEIEYLKDYTYDPTATPDPNTPTKALAKPEPAGGWGLAIGFSYHF